MRSSYMTAHEAKRLSLEIWRYLANNPDVTRKADLPAALFAKVKGLTLCCPLCDLFLRMAGLDLVCTGCPLGSCGVGSCGGDYSLHTAWLNSTSIEERSRRAQRIVDAIEAWDAGSPQRMTPVAGRPDCPVCKKPMRLVATGTAAKYFFCTTCKSAASVASDVAEKPLPAALDSAKER